MLLVEFTFRCGNAELVAKGSAPFIVQRPVLTSQGLVKDGFLHEALGLHRPWDRRCSYVPPLSSTSLHLQTLCDGLRMCRSLLGLLFLLRCLLPFLDFCHGCRGPLARAFLPCWLVAPGS